MLVSLLLRRPSPFNVHRPLHIKHSLSLTTTTRRRTMSTPSLADFSTCELSDALIKIGLPHGDTYLMSTCIHRTLMVPAPDKTSPRPAAHFVDTATQGSVIVIDAPPHTKNAVWGGLMTAGAQARGAIGVVISGRCRDLAEHRSAGFPVFARGHSTLGQSPFTRPSAVNVPLTIQPQFSSEAFSGTFEADGVVCVPVGLIDKVVELAAKGREVDARCPGSRMHSEAQGSCESDFM
ncbi:ribonuclease E inhibitor RraA/Dimethylmenaquinone methyltransferase [Fomitopsis serialis]|uniref:ribonuclease E inhibitor RraA/Dimethylmenaquinone methyltransferase n=1 Tax=Fomitopsis serialis TaxID=139415 RepID=UPI002008E014|nr:ribonuclease E inhibitor RraA/Dimethylmenaquinone methyltransferase [Neoantrodia serialis]KAH9935688.1 ribonuclease E inhibitor RraA/Dimethylmenaquinone methyltransferase [Neoantrodia serialis]